MPSSFSHSSISNLLTIVIPCKNEAQYIGNLLRHIWQQDLGDTRIIVADAQSTDHTRAIVNEWKGILNIEVIEGGSVSFGRNVGAKLATTPFILFLDADVRFFKTTAIHGALETIVCEQLNLVTYKVKNYSNDWRASLLFSIFNGINTVMSKTTPFAMGAFFLTRTETFNTLGRFPDTYTTSEDYLLSKKYHPSKFKILKGYFGQDNRRFLKMGYFGMMKYMVKNFFNRNNPAHFINPDIKYWE
jgi:glycosyltransferase involved in cell wall biosynthesis